MLAFSLNLLFWFFNRDLQTEVTEEQVDVVTIFFSKILQFLLLFFFIFF